jgi:NADH-quinone oxidoreductase subunit L
LLGGHGFKHFLEPVLGHAQEHAVALTTFAENHVVEWAFAGISVLVATLGLLLARALYLGKSETPSRLAATYKGAYQTLLNKYYVDELYESVVIKPIHAFSTFLWKIIDVVLVDKILVLGAPKVLRGVGGALRMLQSGNVQTYAFWIFIGFAALLLYTAVQIGLF